MQPLKLGDIVHYYPHTLDSDCIECRVCELPNEENQYKFKLKDLVFDMYFLCDDKDLKKMILIQESSISNVFTKKLSTVIKSTYNKILNYIQ